MAGFFIYVFCKGPNLHRYYEVSDCRLGKYWPGI